MNLLSKNTGLSLISILFALAIIVSLSAIAAPSMASLYSNYTSLSTAALIHRNLGKARAYAIQNEQEITVCGVNENLHCDASNFKKMIMFLDSNRNAEVDPEEQVLYITPLEYQGQLQLRASLRRAFIRFKKTGASEQAGSFIYCDSKHSRSAKRVTVSMSGRAYLGRDNNNDGIVENTNGEDIYC